jgi:hypothetical protein
MDDVLEPRTLASQVLRTFGVVPDLVALQLRRYFDQSVTLGVVVKDSPGARRNALAGL